MPQFPTVKVGSRSFTALSFCIKDLSYQTKVYRVSIILIDFYRRPLTRVDEGLLKRRRIRRGLITSFFNSSVVSKFRV